MFTRSVGRWAAAVCAAAVAGCAPGEEGGGPGPLGPSLSGNPHAEPEVFAKDVISDAREQWRITFTPDGNTAYYTASDFFFPITRQATILVSHRVDGEWSLPQVAPFSGRYSDIDPFVTPDGSRLYFSSIRPVDGVARPDLELWMVERTATGWSEPVHLGPAVNSPQDELYPSATRDGTLYFASGPFGPNPVTDWDIYRAESSGDGFAPREALGGAINTHLDWSPATPQADWEFNPEISPDGRTLLFTALRPVPMEVEGETRLVNRLGEIYVSHLHRGEWTEPQNLGAPVNTEYDEYHPTVSPDRRHLYFVRRIFRPDPFLFVRGDFYRVEVAKLGNALRPGGTIPAGR